MEIVMPRGDLETRVFQIRSPSQGGTVPFTDNLDEMYFTVKKSYTDRNYKFQKRLSNLTIVPLGEGQYQVTIEPEDTDGLSFGNYVFDVEIVINGELKKTFVGDFILTSEATHACNEVSA